MPQKYGAAASDLDRFAAAVNTAGSLCCAQSDKCTPG